MSSFPDGVPDLSGLFAQLQGLQQQVTAAQEQLGSEEVEGSAGGGAVRIRVSGELVFHAVHIDPAVVAAVVATADAQIVEDLVLAALRDAVAKLASARETVLGDAMGDVLGSLFATESAEPGDDPGIGRAPDSAGSPGMSDGTRRLDRPSAADDDL